jgi:phage-related protein
MKRIDRPSHLWDKRVEPQARKPVAWFGGSRRDLKAFPRPVRTKLGLALHEAQVGRKHPNAKPLRGFGGAGVLEIVVDHDGNAYRGIYTVRFEGQVYVLHVFQKKARHGIATPKNEIELLKRRLRWAERDYEGWRKKNT